MRLALAPCGPLLHVEVCREWEEWQMRSLGIGAAQGDVAQGEGDAPPQPEAPGQATVTVRKEVGVSSDDFSSLYAIAEFETEQGDSWARLRCHMKPQARVPPPRGARARIAARARGEQFFGTFRLTSFCLPSSASPGLPASHL